LPDVNIKELVDYAKQRWEKLIQPMLKRVVGNGLFRDDDDQMDDQEEPPLDELSPRRYVKVTTGANLIDEFVHMFVHTLPWLTGLVWV